MEWISQNRWIVLFAVRFALAVVIFVTGLQIAKRWWCKIGIKILVLYYCIRLVLMWGLIEVIGIVPPDIACWGNVLIDPIVVGKYTVWSFQSVYYIGFVTLGVMLCNLFHSYFGLSLMFNVAEFFALLFLHEVLKKVYDKAIARKTIILYLASPFGVIVSFLGAQDEPLIMLAMFAFLYFVVVRDNLLGRFVSIIFGVLFTKILVLFYMFPVVFQKRVKGLMALVGAFMLYFLARYIGHQNILHIEGLSGVITLGNFWYILNFVPKWLQLGIFAILLSLLMLSLSPNFIKDGASPRESLDSVMVMSVCLHFTFVLCHRMCFSAYLLPMIPFLIVMMRHDAENTVWSGGRIVFVAWLFVATFCDPFLYGIGPTSRNWLLIFSSIVCVFMNIAMLICVVVKYRYLFYSPAEASSLLFAYCRHRLATRRNLRRVAN